MTLPSMIQTETIKASTGILGSKQQYRMRTFLVEVGVAFKVQVIVVLFTLGIIHTHTHTTRYTYHGWRQ